MRCWCDLSAQTKAVDQTLPPSVSSSFLSWQRVSHLFNFQIFSKRKIWKLTTCLADCTKMRPFPTVTGSMQTFSSDVFREEASFKGGQRLNRSPLQLLQKKYIISTSSWGTAFQREKWGGGLKVSPPQGSPKIRSFLFNFYTSALLLTENFSSLWDKYGGKTRSSYQQLKTGLNKVF